MGIEFCIDNLRSQASRFDDPRAIATVNAFAKLMEDHLAMLIMADDVHPRRGGSELG
ncbi:MAG: hypothetical protein AAGK79_03295 [Pseudomonadota bacterium]